jgi:hypothetical protein
VGIMPEIPPTYVIPSHFLHTDNNLGWKNGTGFYKVYLSNTKDFLFEFNTNSLGNRITSTNYSPQNENKPSIHLYGCSSTFGYAIPDTATMGWKLQTKLPNYNVVNKGVPGYGLAQMFLSLQESLSQKDTPRIAIFNYGWFHDIRSPLYEQFSSAIWSAISHGNKKESFRGNFPYYELKNDSLRLNMMPFSEIPKNWPGTEYSAFLIFVNQAFRFQDDSRIPYLHEINKRLALTICDYCKRNNIIPVFAEMVSLRDMEPNYPRDIIQEVKKKGICGFSYPIDEGQEKYNCSPKDPSHPNGIAHTIYAETLFDKISKFNLKNE